MAFENSLSSFPASLLLSCEPQVDGQILGKRLTPGKPRPYRLSFFSLHTWGTVSRLLGRSHVDVIPQLTQPSGTSDSKEVEDRPQCPMKTP